jgi:hypothetical protein
VALGVQRGLSSVPGPELSVLVPSVRPNPAGTTPATGERECSVHPLHIDCDTCPVRGPACGDCVVSVLLGLPGTRSSAPAPSQRPRPTVVRSGRPSVELEGVLVGGAPLPGDLDAEERRALAVLAEAGLVAGLRVLPAAAPVSARRAG